MSRESFLQRVREAVTEGNRAGQPHAAVADASGSSRRVGYQGAGVDPLKRFCDELAAAGGVPHVVHSLAEAAACVIDLVRQHRASRILLGEGPFVNTLELANRLSSQGLEVSLADAGRDSVFRAEIGISGVDALIAETGTIVQSSRPGQPRSLSLTPPVYVAVAERSQVLPDLFDWFDTTLATDVAACYSLITGPSKTGDIELRLVTGVHGPGEVHVVLVNP